MADVCCIDYKHALQKLAEKPNHRNKSLSIAEIIWVQQSVLDYPPLANDNTFRSAISILTIFISIMCGNPGNPKLVILHLGNFRSLLISCTAHFYLTLVNFADDNDD